VKKLPALFLLLFASLALWALEDGPAENEGDTSRETEAVDSGPEGSWEEETPPPPKRKEFRLKNRAFEIGIANLHIGFANDVVAADDFITKTALFDFFKNGEIFREEIEIDINKFLDGFMFDFSFDIRPFFFNVNVKDRWGFGLDIAHIEVSGNTGISENLLGLKQVQNDESTSVGAAVFLDTSIPIFFHINKLKIKFRPAVFVPLVYVPPGGITYSYENSVTNKNGQIISGVKISIKYDLGIYTPIPMEEFLESGKDPDPLAMGQALLDNWKCFGYDFTLGAEYPLNERLDLGLNLTNIPLIPANLGYRMGIKGEVWADTSKIDFNQLLKEDADFEELLNDAYSYPEDMKLVYDEKILKVLRPFKAVAYADWRPFDTRLLSLIPALGLAVNPLYVQPVSIEGGLSVRLDLGNIFIATFGINYMDRKWKNSIDCTLLNLRALQIDLGFVFQSQDFIESWRGAGLAVNFGIKLGW
jgi:hypothetical protein